MLLRAVLTSWLSACGWAQPTALALAPEQPVPTADLAWFVHTGTRHLGFGPGYQARVEPSGVFELWVASSDATAAKPPSLVARLVRVGRRSGLASVGDAHVSSTARRVSVQRPGLCERYDAAKDGVSLSVLDAIPAGAGDLVVEYAVSTDLVPAVRDVEVDRLWYGTADRGIHVGAVTGIDADGRRARGRLCATAVGLELILPERFVATARPPLVVDPLLGSPFWTWPAWESDTRLAYSAATGHYLAAVTNQGFTCWCTVAMCVTVDATGSVVHSTYLGGAHLADAWVYDAAYVRAVDAFVVHWNQTNPYPVGPWSRIQSIDPETGRVAYLHAAASRSELAAENRPAGDRVFVSDPSGVVTAFEVTPAGGFRWVASARFGTSQVHVTRTGGLASRFAGVWTDADKVYATVFDRDLSVLDSGRAVPQGVAPGSAQVTGDGEQWVITYQAGGAMAVPMFWDSRRGEAYTGTPRSLPLTLVATRGLAWLGESVLLAEPSGRAMTVDPFDLTTLEPPAQAFSWGRFEDVVAQRSGDPTVGDLALLAGSEGRFFRAADGQVARLGGGCATSGWPAATGAVVGNPRFVLRLRDAATGVQAVAVLAAAAAAGGCGPCTLHPDLRNAAVVPVGETDARGNAHLALPLPAQASLLGVGVVAQWWVAEPGACLGGVLTDALEIVIE